MMDLADWIGALFGFILTLVVFSYLIGDNPVFRLTLHLFIGVSAGFAATFMSGFGVAATRLSYVHLQV